MRRQLLVLPCTRPGSLRQFAARLMRFSGLLAVAFAIATPAAGADPVVYVNYEQGGSRFALPLTFTWGNGKLRITNPDSNTVPITQVLGAFDREGGPPNFSPGFMYAFDAGPMTAPDGSEGPAFSSDCGADTADESFNFTCTLADYGSRTGGIPPGFSRTFTYDARTDATEDEPAHELKPAALWVFFNFRNAKDRCLPPTGGTDVNPPPDDDGGGDGGGEAATAADSCPPPPTRAKITRAHIDRDDGTAAFHIKARHAVSFNCELFRGRRLIFQRACGSYKEYADRLPPGHYTFRVFALNAYGRDLKGAKKSFTI